MGGRGEGNSKRDCRIRLDTRGLSTTEVPFLAWINASWAVLFLHMFCYVSWLWCLRTWSPGCVAFYIGVPVFLLLFVFSVVNYWGHRRFWLGPR